MKFRTFGSVLSILVIAMAIVLWFRGRSKIQPQEISLFFTCDLRGRLVPCGCFTGQHGGLTRLRTFLDENAGPFSLCVDVGNAIKGAQDFEIIEHRYLLKALAGMHYAVLNLGQREVQLPLATLHRLKKESPVSLISANVFDAKRNPVFDAFKIVQLGAFRIGFVGVVDPEGLKDAAGEGVHIESMETVLAQILPGIKKQVDMLVLLACTDESGLRRLAGDFYEIDVVLGGKVSQPSQKLEQINRSLLLYTANEARTAGKLKLLLSKTDPPSPVEHDIQLLHDQIPENAEVQKLAQQYRDEIRRTPLDIDDPSRLGENDVPGVKAAATYVGSESCQPCHPTATRIWKISRHSHAFASLKNKQADADPNCIPCHVMGFGAATGYRRAFAGSKLIDVGCESCHGAGSLHVAQKQSGASGFRFRPLGAGDCKKCHHGEFSRPFDWDKFWPQIKHGLEP